ncbi:MAG: TIGR01212 family radical SAM protein [Myxococcales bacterium]|nr:MAG: TIGR01212 family radical SAM protein [Myxococcales bacterium]
MNATTAPTHFNSYNAYLRLRFGGRVAKISLDLGIPCPHRRDHPPGCVYCRPGVIVADRIGALGSITNQLNAGILAVGARYETDLFLAYFQNESASAGDLKWLLERYDEAFNHPKIVGVTISTRPDMAGDTLLDMLMARTWRKPVFLEFGLQSAHAETLARINRGHDAEIFADAVGRATARRLPVTAHAILGLPGETPEMMVETFRFLGGLPLDAVKVHHLQIYRGAALEAPWWRGEVKTFARFEDYLPVLLDCLEVLPWRIKVQRLVADAPRTHLLAPDWGLAKNDIIARVEAGFAARETRQGSRANPAHSIPRLF